VLIRKLATLQITSFLTIYHIFFMVLCCVMLLACAKKDDPSPSEFPGLRIDSVTVSEGNAGETKQASFTVRLSPARDEVVTIDYEFISTMEQVEQIISEHKEKNVVGEVADIDPSEVNLVSDDDVVALEKSRLTFDSGETEKTIIVDVIGDALYEADEIFAVRLSNASNGVTIVLSGGLGTVENDDSAPQATIVMLDDASNILSESEQPVRRFAVKLDNESGVDALLKFEYGSPNTVDIATFRGDYMVFDDKYDVADLSLNRVPVGSEFSILVGQVEQQFVVRVIDDGRKENEEIIQINLVSENNHAVVGRDYSDVVMKIASNDQIDIRAFRPLNDTGASGFAGDPGWVEVSDKPVAEFPLQDADVGRDAVNPEGTLRQKAGMGKSGFDFTALNMEGKEVKLNEQGHPLDMVGNEVELNEQGDPLDLTYEVRCVKDNVTQLVWEIKKRGNAGLQAAGKLVYWYEPDPTINGGDAGKRGSEDCISMGRTCNIMFYTAEINLLNLCGMAGWRVPAIGELRSIADYGRHGTSGMAKLAYDTRFFSNEILGLPIWSSTPSADHRKALTMRYSGQPSMNEVAKDARKVATVRLVSDTRLTLVE